MPDATTIWLFREALAQAGLIDKPSERLHHARRPNLDATIVSVPKQRNTKEKNEAIKAGKTPEGWDEHPPRMLRRTKTRAGRRRTMKASTATRTMFGQGAHNLICTWDATDAAVHDRQKTDDVLDLSNTGKDVLVRTASTARRRSRRA